MVANVLAAAVLAEACFALPDFALASAASIAMTILLSLTSFSLLEESASDAHSVMYQAKILKSSPASDSLWRIAASFRNGGRRTELRGVQSLCFLKIKISFAPDGDKIHLPIAEVLLRAAAGYLAQAKKQRYWTPRNAVLLP